MKRFATTMLAGALLLPSVALAEDISTHVLNIATGEGGGDVPVTLSVADDDGWRQLGRATTQDNGRVEGFGVEAEEATYLLTFDMTEYDAFGDEPFFPEIAIVFTVSDADRHHHVPVLVSPYGYSTYLGN